MKKKLGYYENTKGKKRKTFLEETGYAFIDEYGNCHIIVYGETLRKYYEKFLIKD